MTVDPCHERCPPALRRSLAWREMFELFSWYRQFQNFDKSVSLSLWGEHCKLGFYSTDDTGELVRILEEVP